MITKKIASKIVKPSYRTMPDDPQELRARLWADRDFRNDYAAMTDDRIIQAITGKASFEEVADEIAEIVMRAVNAELLNLGLREHFGNCADPIRYVVYGLMTSRLDEMKQRAEWTHDDEE